MTRKQQSARELAEEYVNARPGAIWTQMGDHYGEEQMKQAFLAGWRARGERDAEIVVEATRIPDCAIRRGTGVRDEVVIIGERIADRIRALDEAKEETSDG